MERNLAAARAGAMGKREESEARSASGDAVVVLVDGIRLTKRVVVCLFAVSGFLSTDGRVITDTAK